MKVIIIVGAVIVVVSALRWLAQSYYLYTHSIAHTRQRHGLHQRSGLHAANAFEASQGHYLPQSVASTFELRQPGIPLCNVAEKTVGIPYKTDAGHTIVIAPTRSGKGLHCTEVLGAWPAAAIVVDPKGEQYARTAQRRSGPCYRLPGDSIDLLDYFDPAQSADIRALYRQLFMRPGRSEHEASFIEKAEALLWMAIAVGKATNQHPLRLASSWSEQSPVIVLREAQRYAPGQVIKFLDGGEPESILDNGFAQSAWGMFTTNFQAFAPFVHTFSTATIPADWCAQGATLYLTYPMHELRIAAPLISALLTALVRGQMRREERYPALLIVDEMPTVAPDDLAMLLATMGGYGLTALLYAQNLTQIEEVYGQPNARAILSNCTSQLWYKPVDLETATYLSQIYGNVEHIEPGARLQAPHNPPAAQPNKPGFQPTFPTSATINPHPTPQIRPALDPAQILALARDAVICFSAFGGETPIKVIARRIGTQLLGKARQGDA